jgi:hypothetical protein
MSIKIQITPKELQELEQNGSALIALFKAALENQNMNRLTLADNSVKESKISSSKVNKKNAKAATKVKAEALKVTHQLLAEIIRNSEDLLSVKAKAKESNLNLKRNEIIALATDKTWVKKYNLSLLPEIDDVFRMTDTDFEKEVLNHFMKRLISVAGNLEGHLEVYFEGELSKTIEHANWRASVYDDIVSGKKANSTERYNQIDTILLSAVKSWASTQGSGDTWNIIILDNDIGFVISPKGACHILDQ